MKNFIGKKFCIFLTSFMILISVSSIVQAKIAARMAAPGSESEKEVLTFLNDYVNGNASKKATLLNKIKAMTSSAQKALDSGMEGDAAMAQIYTYREALEREKQRLMDGYNKLRDQAQGVVNSINSCGEILKELNKTSEPANKLKLPTFKAPWR